MDVRVIGILMCGMAFGCSGHKPLDIQPQPPQEGEQQYIPAEGLVFRLNGKLYTAGGTIPRDTARLHEEGLRTLEIAGYTPEDAAPPTIEAINFYRDVYSFNYAGDSICILGGSSAQPKNHYVSPVGEGFGPLVGKMVPPVGRDSSLGGQLPPVRFYNYVDRIHDETVVDRGNGPETVKWSSIGKYRLYRVEVAVAMQNAGGTAGKKVFSLPYYELENSVQVENLRNGVIEISPGDTVYLQKLVNAPPEFTQYEWVKGNATTRFSPLNGDAVEGAYNEKVSNPLQTERGMRFTDSMVRLGRNGMLTVDSRWNPVDAASNGGAIYATIPICVIMMPQGGSQSDSLVRDFLFPDNILHKEYPTPFFCNAQVKIVY